MKESVMKKVYKLSCLVTCLLFFTPWFKVGPESGAYWGLAALLYYAVPLIIIAASSLEVSFFSKGIKNVLLVEAAFIVSAVLWCYVLYYSVDFMNIAAAGDILLDEKITFSTVFFWLFLGCNIISFILYNVIQLKHSLANKHVVI